MSFYLVLGMHRSGTSCLTGALERCGLYLGDVKRKGKHNKKGYFEKEEVYKMHDQILGLNKGSWNEPPTMPIRIHPHHEQQLKEVVTQLQIKTPCGLKDPRTLLLLDFWKEIIGDNYQFIGTFRHPMAVALSLYSRSQMPIEQGLKLWVKYNTILVEEHQKKTFPLIHFDLSNSKLYFNNIVSVARNLGLQPKTFQLKWFISSKLEHHNFKEKDVPNACKELYKYLQENSKNKGI